MTFLSIIFQTYFAATSAFAAPVYDGDCDVAFENKQYEWEVQFDAAQTGNIQKVYQMDEVSFTLKILPGGAAFADVMSVAVQSPKNSFELYSLVVNGYASIIYKGRFESKNLAFECQVRTKRY